MFVALSSQIAEEFQKKTGFDVLALNEYSALDAPVSSHADMLLCVIDNNVFCYNEYYNKNISIFEKIEKKYNVIKIEKECLNEYPNDVALNVLIIGKTIFSRLDSTAREIIEYAKNNGYKLVNVKQGYTCCSTLVLNEKSAITSDVGIYNTLKKEGYNALLVSNEVIELKGYNCGFIGGVGGVYSNTVYFFGDISMHPEYEKISSFLEENNCKIISILSGGVYDFGGIKFL